MEDSTLIRLDSTLPVQAIPQIPEHCTLYIDPTPFLDCRYDRRPIVIVSKKKYYMTPFVSYDNAE